jgi:hypothetical protein
LNRWSRIFLRYWSLNMAYAWANGIPTTGFSYDDREQARMLDLARSISGRAAIIWLGAAVILFILVAIAAVAGVMVPIVTHAWSGPAKMPALAFFLLLFSVCAVTVGLGLPLAITLGGALADRLDGGDDAAALPIDDDILGRARWQICRMMAVSLGLCVPGAMFFITFDIDPRPVVFWLRIGSIALSAVSWLLAWWARGLAPSPRALR